MLDSTKNYYRLRLPPLKFAEGFEKPVLNPDKQTHSFSYAADKIMAAEMIEDFRVNFGINLQECFLFTVTGKHYNSYHIDGIGRRLNIWTINYIFGTNDSKMCWYKAKPGTTPTVYKPDITNMIHIWEPHEVDVIEECPTKEGDILLARTDLIHNAVNNDPNTTRWAWTFRGSKWLTWDQIVERFAGVSIVENARVS